MGKGGRRNTPGSAAGADGWRTESDSLGKVRVPVGALYGAQTARALGHFQAGGRSLPWRFVVAQLEVKEACASASVSLGAIDRKRADAIRWACRRIRDEGMEDQFRVDFLQAGAGTSQNMNVNEVVATLASRKAGVPVHPNDHVNAFQSTNDTFPTAMQVALHRDIADALAPSFGRLADALEAKTREFSSVRKPGRTHMQDAVPMTLGEEVSGWAAACRRAQGWLAESAGGLLEIPLGGNAVGRGTNAPAGFREAAVRELARLTRLPLVSARNPFEATQNPYAVLHACSSIDDSAVTLSRICSDIILLSSGPRTGLGELRLNPLQPGSSFMPGKVNPVMAEMARMAAVHAQGCCHAARTACAHGALELNVSMPVIAYESLDAAFTLAHAVDALTDKCVKTMSADHGRCAKGARETLGNATLLAPAFGYAESARLAKLAWDEGLPLDEVVAREKAVTLARAQRMLGLDDVEDVDDAGRARGERTKGRRGKTGKGRQ